MIKKIKKFLIYLISKLPFSYQLYMLRIKGISFFIHQRKVKKHESFTQGQMNQYQLQKFKDLIAHVYNYVPYYRNEMKNLGLNPGDFQSLEDIRKLPLIRKEHIKENRKLFQAENAQKYSPENHKTSGSSGQPFEFWIDRRVVSFCDALGWRRFRWAGYQMNDTHAIMRMPIGFRQGKIDKEKLYFYDPITKMLELNTLFFDHHLEEYCQLMKKYHIEVLVSYPSLLDHFAKYILKGKIDLPMKTVISGAEMMQPHQRKRIQKAFQSKMFDCFGLEERVIYGSECPEGKMHIFFDSGILEIIKDGKPCKIGEIGEFVCTGLHNRSMPLIRYGTGDYGCFTGEQCPCGIKMLVIKIHGGRERSLIATSQGYVNIHPESGIEFELRGKINQMQIYQDKIDEIVLKVVPNANFTSEDKDFLESYYFNLLNQTVKVKVISVEKIDRLPSGKFKYVDSKVKL